MSDILEALRDAKASLKAQREVSRRQARQYEIELNREVESAVDGIARAALEENISRTVIARELGESRVTVNERIHRAYGNPVAPKAHRVPVTKDVQGEAPTSPFYLLDKGAGTLTVEYKDYGPDNITGTATLEVIEDHDSGDGTDYWFLGDGVDLNEVHMVLDTIYTGWYYEDALAFVKEAMAKEKEED